MELPSPDEARVQLAGLSQRERKIVGGLFAVMVREPTKVRDREWLLGRLAQVAALSNDGGDPESDPTTDLEALQGYLAEHHDRLLGAAFLLFHRVAVDLEAQAAEGFGFEDAMGRALAYLTGAEHG